SSCDESESKELGQGHFTIAQRPAGWTPRGQHFQGSRSSKSPADTSAPTCFYGNGAGFGAGVIVTLLTFETSLSSTNSWTCAGRLTKFLTRLISLDEATKSVVRTHTPVYLSPLTVRSNNTAFSGSLRVIRSGVQS